MSTATATRCEFQKLQSARGLPNKGHSDDIVTVYSGHAVPHRLCGFHATYYPPDFYDFLRTDGRADR